MGSFMRGFATFEPMWRVDTNEGDVVIPVSVAGDDPMGLRDYVSGWIHEAEIEEGWWARLSAPGYLDATEWQGPYDSEAEALADLAEDFDICPGCWEQCWETDSSCGGEE